MHTPSFSPDSVKVLAFDIFGTVVDWHGSIAREVQTLYPQVDGDAFALAWRAGYKPAMQRVMSGELGWTLIDDLHRMILDILLPQFGLAHLSEAERQHLNRVWHRLDAWPDSVAGLTRLKGKYIISTLSNGNIGLLTAMAKRAGLLHDIGKVPDEETELTHALLGAKLAEKYGENPAVVNAIGAHHDEMEMQYVISPIIQACDAISGARPGARREIMQQYLQRIKDLENLAMAYTGVEKAYAIQAGRELRVIVEADKVTDMDSDKLSFEIAQKIQTEMTYPGQIKVTVIREKRAINVAR